MHPARLQVIVPPGLRQTDSEKVAEDSHGAADYKMLQFFQRHDDAEAVVG
jgi:hypothetical protein